MSTLNINDNNFLRQFEVSINGQLAKVEYALQERKIFLTKIILPENTTDQFKEDFLVQIFEIIKDRKLRMMPTSSEIKKFLKSKGLVCVEIGYDQKKDVKRIFKMNDFRIIEEFKDLNKKDRVLIFENKI